MAKAHYAVYRQGTTLWISPDAVIVSSGKDVWIRNYTGFDLQVGRAIAGPLPANKKRKFSTSGLAIGVYTFDVVRGRTHARAHSSPMLIIDG